MSEPVEVVEQYGIDAVAGAQHLKISTYESGTVLVVGSMVATAVPCSHAQWVVQVERDATTKAEWEAGLEANRAAYEIAHPERAAALAAFAEAQDDPSPVT